MENKIVYDKTIKKVKIILREVLSGRNKRNKEVYYIYGKHATKDMFLNDNELPILKYEIEKSKCKIQVCVDNETNQFYYILYLNQDDAMELGLIGGEFQILK